MDALVGQGSDLSGGPEGSPSHGFPDLLSGGFSDPEVSMPIATELLERASDNREQAVRVRKLCPAHSAARDKESLEAYAVGLEQAATDLERHASGLVGA